MTRRVTAERLDAPPIIGHVTEAYAQEPPPATDGSPAAGGRAAGRGAATRVRLLAAAAQLIAERGWGGVTTRLVAQRAGVNGALVHYHFGSMETLLREAALGSLVPGTARALGTPADARPLEDVLVGAGVGPRPIRPGSWPGLLVAEVLLRATRDADLARAMGEGIRGYRLALEERLSAAAQRGEVRDDVQPDVIAMVIAATLDGLLLQRLADPHLDSAAVAAGLARLLARRE